METEGAERMISNEEMRLRALSINVHHATKWNASPFCRHNLIDFIQGTILAEC